MSSLTFARPPPLVPTQHALILEESTSDMEIDQEKGQTGAESPVSPHSPLNAASPTDPSFLAGVARRPAQPRAFGQLHAHGTVPGMGMRLGMGDTPTNTPVPRPAGRVGLGGGGAPITSPRGYMFNSSLGGAGHGNGLGTPVNTPANRPPPAGRLSLAGAPGSMAPGRVGGGLDHMHVPSSLSTPLGGAVQPLNAATAMRGRAIGVGIGSAGRDSAQGGSAAAERGTFTPGNTPSSLERVSRRLANNLQMAEPREGVTHQIAPSYERRFNAGLLDLNHKLAGQPEQSDSSQMDAMGQSLHQTYGNSLVRNDWPIRFDADTVMSAGNGEEKRP